MLRLTVNGKQREVEAPLTIAGFLASLGYDVRYVAVARNGDVLDRETFGAVALEDGDRLEIVRPVGGGA